MTNPQSPVIDIFRDGHVHTHLCRHASGTMEDYARAAIAKELRGIVFLEHMESGIDYFDTTWLSEKDFDVFFKEGERLQKKYRDRLEIGLGVEVGYNPAQKDELVERLSKREWDRIGVSFHYFKHPDLPHHLNLVSRKKWNIDAMGRAGGNALLHQYFDTLIEGVRHLPGTVLCHLDAGLRYLPGLHLSKNHIKKIAALLDAVKDKGMAVEINTSGIPIRGEPFPAASFVEMAIRRGIRLVAGSDAHRPEDVGRYFNKLPDFLNAEIHP
jgi:histidinol-phosphatase (PHP family)